MDCPTEAAAFTDRTGTAAAQASEIAAVQVAEATATRATDIAPLEAVPILDPELFPADDEMVAEDTLTGDTAPAPGEDVSENEDASDADDEGPIEELLAFEQANADADGETGPGIPQEILDALANPAATTGEASGEPAKATEAPEKKQDDAPIKKVEGAAENGPDAVAADEGVAAGDDDGADDDDPLADLSPEDRAIAMGEAQNAAATGAESNGGTDDTPDMGDGTAMTADMCPMEAAGMMAGETSMGMADIASDMMGEMDMADIADTEMSDMDDMG